MVLPACTPVARHASLIMHDIPCWTRACTDMLQVSTTVGVVERMLRARYHKFTHKFSTEFEVIRIGDGSYSLPTEVADAIDFVSPSIRFPVVQSVKLSKPQAGDIGVTPSFLRSLYKVGDATGTASNNNQTVASFLGQYYAPSDLASFFTQFSKTEVGKTPTVVGPNDASNPGIEARYVSCVGSRFLFFSLFFVCLFVCCFVCVAGSQFFWFVFRSVQPRH